MKALSEKRSRLLHLIGSYQHSGRFPLVRELAQELGLAGESSLSAMLRSLERDGYLTKHGGGNERRHRIYTLTPKGETAVPEVLGRLRLPVLGAIPAGPLMEAVQQCDEFIDPGDSLSTQAGDFFLAVRGDSMSGDGILPGDRVLLRPHVHVHNGEIAGVQIKGQNGLYESTLKHVHYQPGKKTVRLRASNPAYEDRVVPAKNVEIVGVYRGLIRRPP